MKIEPEERPRGKTFLAGFCDVTPIFPKKTKCKPICMPGSIFMHIVDISE
jgi:hypothetical protein